MQQAPTDPEPEPESEQEPERNVSARLPTRADRRLQLVGGSCWARRVFAYQCSVLRGAQPVRTRRLAADSNTVGVCTRRPPRAPFEGNCFDCGAAGHSQNYCPLKRCERCTLYGHSTRVCETDVSAAALDVPTEAAAQDAQAHDRHHSAPLVRGARRRYEFGSGWRRQRGQPRS